MIRRGIYLPSRRLVLGTAFAFFSFVTLTHVGWALTVGRGLPVAMLMTSLQLTTALLVLIGVTIDIMHRLDASGWRFETPHGSRWLVYYGTWFVLGLAIGVGRLAMLQAWSPEPLSSAQAIFVPSVCLYMTLATIVLLEHQTMFRTVIARKQQASLKAVRFLVDTHQAFVEAQDLRRNEALAFLDRRVEPELADVHARLTQPRLPSPDDLESVQARLERLRNVEIREVSHLLHPSILDMGLVPALRALVRNRASEIPITLVFEGVTPADGSPAVARHLYRIVEHALDLARDEALREIRIGMTRVDGSRLRLEIAGRGDGLDRALAREHGARVLFDARVALMGGAWGLEESERDQLLLWVEAPIEGSRGGT
ncbi:hypothetical protein D3C87_928860 [compost metagenome]